MFTDPLKAYRKKSRYILEIRHSPLTEIFDNRGRIINTIHPSIKKDFPHWKVQNAVVEFADNLESPLRQIVFGHMRIVFEYESLHSYETIYSEIADVLKMYADAVGGVVPQNISRVGFRSISILNFPGSKSFDDVLNKIKSKYLIQEFPVSLPMSDVKIVMNHPNGCITLGPVKKDEHWVKDSYSRPDKDVPLFGYGLDVDSAVSNIALTGVGDIVSSIEKLINLSLSTEVEVVRPFVGV